ncbi:MAG: hypothetical protein IT380_03595 [Myxococcales bacterium]|nr:hypothetical protein [Myxococcales bacterium]
MSVIIRYVCHHCGAAREGAGGAGWVRCGHCDVLIAFDWQAWFGSAQYAAYLRVAGAPETLAGWQRYQARSADAERLVASGAFDAARAATGEAVEQLVRLMPGVYPDELQTDATYRRRYLEWLSAVTYAQKVDPELSRLTKALEACVRRVEARDPLPTLDEAARLLELQADRLAHLELPDDPDGMPPHVRLRASMSQFLGGYVQLASPEQIRALLERIHGRGNVFEAGAGVESLGLFREWRCPACGLVSLEASMVLEHTCPACVLRAPKGDPALPQVDFACGRCGAALTLEAGERECCCAFCDTWVRRVDRTGHVERQHAYEVRDSLARRLGLALAELPAESRPGLPVTKENRRAHRLTGLARVAAMYGAMVPARRVLGLVTATFREVKGQALLALLDEVGEAARAEGLRGALEVLDEVRSLVR